MCTVTTLAPTRGVVARAWRVTGVGLARVGGWRARYRCQVTPVEVTVAVRSR